MPPSSDKQFLAIILLKVWKGDQITDTEERRLRLLAQDSGGIFNHLEGAA